MVIWIRTKVSLALMLISPFCSAWVNAATSPLLAALFRAVFSNLILVEVSQGAYSRQAQT